MIFLFFVLMTLLEITVLISVGQAIGSLSTILLIIATAFIGSRLLKQQGWATMARAQQNIAEGQQPTIEILEGVVILISGVLLITPGFITDILGLLGLIPFSRQYFINSFLEKNTERFFSRTTTFYSSNSKTNSEKKKSNNTIEGEYWED
ncbi:MAG: FxsA family protein [Gammaproteobacteria bacterium]